MTGENSCPVKIQESFSNKKMLDTLKRTEINFNVCG